MCMSQVPACAKPRSQVVLSGRGEKMPKSLNKSLSPEGRTSVRGKRSHWHGVGTSWERGEGHWGEIERDGPGKSRWEGSLDMAEPVPI